MKKCKAHKYFIMLTLMIIWGSINQVFAKDISLIINGNPIITESKPINVRGTILVPLRIIGEELGVGVSWDGIKKEITLNKDNREIRLTIDSTVGYINSEKVMLSVPPKSINGITMVPIRFVSENLECGVRWDNSKGLINIEAQGNLDIVEKEVIEQDKNIYTAEYLEKLVEETPCSEEVKKFRATINPRRNGLLKEEGKYFDIYYPDTEYAKEQLEIVKPHMDKAYMMLTDLYGIQAKVEVHFIDGEVGRKEMNLEGAIRDKENVTFVWLEEGGNDIATGNQNLTEMIHEMNHNFFDQTNGKRSYKLWLNEANAKLIPSLYRKYNCKNDNNYEDFYRIQVMYNNVFNNMKISNNELTIQDVDKYMSKGDAWDEKDSRSKEGIAYDYAIVLWNYIYNQCSDLGIFKDYLRSMDIGSDNSLITLEKFLNKPIQVIEKDFLSYLDK